MSTARTGPAGSRHSVVQHHLLAGGVLQQAVGEGHGLHPEVGQNDDGLAAETGRGVTEHLQQVGRVVHQQVLAAVHGAALARHGAGQHGHHALK